MRAVLALLAFILVFFALNVDRLVTIAWWKRRRIEAIAYRQAGSAVIGRRLGMMCSGASIEPDSRGHCIVTDPNLIQYQGKVLRSILRVQRKHPYLHGWPGG